MSGTPNSFSHVLFNNSYGNRFLKIIFLILTPSLVFLLLGCGKGLKAKVEVNELTGLRSGDTKFKTNDLVPANRKFEEFVIKDEDAQSFYSTKQSIGRCDKGSLVNATFLPEEGDGFIASPTHRSKHYSSFELQKVITFAAKTVHDKYPKSSPIRIGNLSKMNGGPSGGHESHQNGTDADVFYYSYDSNDNDLTPNMVSGGRTTKNFDAPRTYLYVKSLVSTGRVIRILVDRAVKNALCIQASLMNDSTVNNETLRRLRPTPGHTDHMHVRIYCPFNSAGHCENQLDLDISEGTGCPLFTPIS